MPGATGNGPGPLDPLPVGVIGGVGPLATAYFLQSVVQLTQAERDQDHVDMVVLNHASIPDRTAYILGTSTEDPAPVLAADAQRLERFGVSFLVMPCNTAHYFTEQVLAAVTVPLLSIIDTAVDASIERAAGSTVVGLLATAGTIASQVYFEAFRARGVDLIVPDDDDQAILNTVIYDQVKAGEPVDIAAVRAVAERLRARGAVVVLLGCTELSVVAQDFDLLAEPLYIDSMDRLARATIRRAGGTVRS